jgi:hypothetical protein
MNKKHGPTDIAMELTADSKKSCRINNPED